MTYVDTNVLVRLITGDNIVLRNQAVHMIESSAKNSIIVHATVLAELGFVLEFHEYKMQRKDICSAMRSVFELSSVKMDNNLLKIITIYEANPKLDFTDALLLAESNGSLMTFDKDLQKLL